MNQELLAAPFCKRRGCNSLVGRAEQVYCSAECAPLGNYGNGSYGFITSPKVAREHAQHVTIEEMALMVRCTRQNLLRWMRVGLIPGVKTEFGIAFRPELVIEAMNMHRLPRNRTLY